MRKCGLLGKKLGHSYSPYIHNMLGNYEYLLYEKTEEELPEFIKNGQWDGLNVTIPYKKAVIPFCDSLSDTAKATGSVNTLVKDRNGRIYGDNTDVYGFMSLVEKSGITVSGEKALVLGSGGASVSVCYALKELGAEPVVISRTGENNYGNLYLNGDARIIVNTTPVGMYPNNGEAPLDLNDVPKCRGVLDIIYNPSKTALLLQAEKKSIPFVNGLYMLVAQAKKSSELFTGSEIPDEKTDEVFGSLESDMLNIVIVGMPGSGKSTVAGILSEMTGRRLVDTDEEIVKNAGRSIPDIIKEDGEKAFRDMETEAIKNAGKMSGIIISTGGGCVIREENRDMMRQNGRVFRLERDVSLLPKEGRPLSLSGDLHEMYLQREPYYKAASDFTIRNDGSRERPAAEIAALMKIHIQDKDSKSWPPARPGE